MWDELSETSSRVLEMGSYPSNRFEPPKHIWKVAYEFHGDLITKHCFKKANDWNKNMCDGWWFFMVDVEHTVDGCDILHHQKDGWTSWNFWNMGTYSNGWFFNRGSPVSGKLRFYSFLLIFQYQQLRGWEFRVQWSAWLPIQWWRERSAARGIHIAYNVYIVLVTPPQTLKESK